MNKLIATLALVLLASCQSTPKLEDDTRYVRLATVVDKREFSDIERKQAQASSGNGSGVSIGFGVGMGGYGTHSGMMMGMGSHERLRDEPPQIAKGAIRYTVRPVGSEERIEVMSYLQHQVGDCVKVLANHPEEYPRFFERKAGEECDKTRP